MGLTEMAREEVIRWQRRETIIASVLVKYISKAIEQLMKMILTFITNGHVQVDC